MTLRRPDHQPGHRPDERDLAGCRILVPRGGEAGERLAAEIRERGGIPMIAPLTVTAAPEHPAALAAAVERWNRGGYDWLAITSANGAHAVADAGARPGAGSVAAVGPATAEALRERGFTVDARPEHDFSATGLAEALLATFGSGSGPAGSGSGPVGPGAPAQRVLLPLSEIAGDELERALAAAGHTAERVTAYRTIPAARDPRLEAQVRAGGVDAILVMSGSGAAEAARRFSPLPESTRLVAIGQPTARALADHGLSADAVSPRHTSTGLLDTLAATLARDSAPAQPAGPDPVDPGPARAVGLPDRSESPHHPEGSSA